MHTTRLIFALMGSLTSLSSASPPDKPALTRQEVVALLGRGIDDSPEDRKNFRNLLDAGERAYPAMAEMLLDGSEPDAIRTIIPVFIQSTGDKSLPIEAMKEYIEDQIGLVPPNEVVCVVIAALGKIGGVQEAEFMRKYLDFEDPIIRHSFEGNLAILEKRLAAEKKADSFHKRTGRIQNDGSSETSRRSSSERFQVKGTDTPIATHVTNYPGWVAGVLVVLIAVLYFFIRKRQISLQASTAKRHSKTGI